MPQHQMKGPRVAYMSQTEIEKKAALFSQMLELNKQTQGKKRKRQRFDQFFERLLNYGIEIAVLEDEDWQKGTLNLVEGYCMPSQLTINIPNRVYEKACHGEPKSLEVMFHELGHILLMHSPRLHFSEKAPTKEEDSEWQADVFAEKMLILSGIKSPQLSFAF
ncbi:ImmA/IrrE family metallo-endopeptidase [Plesiomonas shigelloides]|uniref:ImmA/IrrE family metallo-endopeptidase n=1 Tax=Plesiomonas shigelloides TaxID=703 RepID=UPI00126228A3|nr:ImmA/IrrE family metallo-endopeptidase [Plesiomonas shigelloides]KAB7660483.1 ImmA/IrrE family metallo-endopeptidase [Plesiomonas shigelloides]